MKKITILVTILAGLLVTNIALAHETEQPEKKNDRQGLFIGITAGGGTTAYTWEDGKKQIWEEGEEGAFGSLRIGYAVTNSWAFSIEGMGFGHEDDDQETGIGAAIAAVTWHPCGSGFFLRAGVGGGGGEFHHPETGELKKIKRRLAGHFGLGYDWKLGNDFTLGLSFDTLGLEAEDSLDLDQGGLGSSSVGIQFNWFL